MPAVSPTTELMLSGDEASARFGALLAQALRPGDPVMLSGGLGAGKSTIARAAVTALLAVDGRREDIPSPTFTLVQCYETEAAEIWHVDLYRLSAPEECVELGLVEAFATAITLVEWPERLGPEAPGRRLEIDLEMTPDGEGRLATLRPIGSGWDRVMQAVGAMNRADLAIEFLQGAGWGAATRSPLAGDASNRRYERLKGPGGHPAVLMDAPPEKGEDVGPFAALACWLRDQGFSAPEVLAADTETGFLLLEDLGDALYTRVAAAQPEAETGIYAAAIDLLAELAGLTPPERLSYPHASHIPPPYDGEILRREAELLTDWWMPNSGHGPVSADLAAEYAALITECCQLVAGVRTALVLRDYHAENLIWLPERRGSARVGLLDFQDALVGAPAYDLVSLLEDARRDTSGDLRQSMIDRHLAARPGVDRETFLADYAVLGAQRNLKIIGIFARLCIRDGKPAYLAHIPRVWSHLRRDLAHPALAPLRRWIDRWCPAPSPAILDRLADL